MVAVRIAYTRSAGSPAQIVRQQRRWAGADDTGRYYSEIGRVDSDVDQLLLSTRFFTPGDAPEASALTLTVAEPTGGEVIAQALPLR